MSSEKAEDVWVIRRRGRGSGLHLALINICNTRMCMPCLNNSQEQAQPSAASQNGPQQPGSLDQTNSSRCILMAGSKQMLVAGDGPSPSHAIFPPSVVLRSSAQQYFQAWNLGPAKDSYFGKRCVETFRESKKKMQLRMFGNVL